jgi:peptidoglycan/xylan/chitin deacetylase (PgdA/CDA1 family)
VFGNRIKSAPLSLFGRGLTAALIVLGMLPAAADVRQEVALTFDDLPVHGDLPPGVSRREVVGSLLASLRAHAVPPTYGFVNAQALDGGLDHVEVLRLWRAAGHPLGSHTFSHMDLHANTVDAFEQDIAANEATLRTHMGEQDWRWLRFPYLHEGETLEKRVAVARLLARRNYRVAQVSLNHDDWAFTDPYARCITRNDTAALGWIAERYVRRAATSLSADLERTTSVFGRDIPHVMLLHAGAFQAKMLPALLELLEARGFRFITLQHAQADGAYAMDPGQPFPSGATWLDQMAAARGLKPRPAADDTMARLSAICR